MDMRNFLFLLQVIFFIRNISSNDENRSDEGFEQRKKRSYSIWTSEMNAEFAKIYKDTKSNTTHHFGEVKDEWYKLHPDSEFTVAALYTKYLKTYHQIEQKGKRPMRSFEWNEEKYADLVDAYLHTRPYDQYSSTELSDEWKCRHHDCPNYENKYLSKRAREWIRKQKLSVQGESSKRLFEWTSRQDSDLLHAYHVTLPEKKSRLIAMHRIFADLHPDLRELTADQMTKRTEFLQRNPLDEHFPWTKEQNKELLEIYHSTWPGVSDQGQRIYDIWSKIHPKYSFMTPYYLQVHASTLAHREKTKDSIKRWKTKFTDEQRAFAKNAHRLITKSNKSFYDFHREWVRKYPSMAYLNPKILTWDVQRWFRNNDFSSEDNTEGEQQSEPRKYRRRQRNFYTPEEKAELLTIHQQTGSKDRENRNRLFEKWIEERKNNRNITLENLKKCIRDWVRKASKKKGKEPMLTLKTELEFGSSPNASDMSQ